ncbi:MAG: 23S rRNA (pseudouridine(1915)-N(3))-methyltransferase RlmH [Bacillota bacterium]|nr:23S rRNA (pseudouridine(1915)-N(3))-methyltransferase RlmH [Bacillota bacterium]
MSIKIIAVGKIRDKNITACISEYEKRLSGFCDFEIIETNEQRFGTDNASQAEIESALNKESVDILKKIPPRSHVIALCVEGRQTDSLGFSKLITDCALNGISCIAFIIGSSYGLANAVKSRADMKLSFSAMTFPHGLMRLILCEQIFRAFKISTGETYHK